MAILNNVVTPVKNYLGPLMANDEIKGSISNIVIGSRSADGLLC